MVNFRVVKNKTFCFWSCFFIIAKKYKIKRKSSGPFLPFPRSSKKCPFYEVSFLLLRNNIWEIIISKRISPWIL